MNPAKHSRNIRQCCVEVMEHLWQSDGSHCSFPVPFRQIDDTGPECDLDLDEGLIAVGQKVLGLARVDTNYP